MSQGRVISVDTFGPSFIHHLAFPVVKKKGRMDTTCLLTFTDWSSSSIGLLVILHSPLCPLQTDIYMSVETFRSTGPHIHQCHPPQIQRRTVFLFQSVRGESLRLVMSAHKRSRKKKSQKNNRISTSVCFLF